MNYYVAVNRKKRNTAGSKAPDDINELCRRNGMTRLEMPEFPAQKNKIYKKLWLIGTVPVRLRRICSRLEKGDVILYQHPMYGYRVWGKYVPKMQKKGIKCIALIHDLESLRKGIAGLINDNKRTNAYADCELLKKFDRVICHNRSMKEYLISQGFKEEQLVVLEIFDYLAEDIKREPYGERLSIAIAGNLIRSKCGYIYGIHGSGENRLNGGLRINLYGSNYDGENGDAMTEYHGSFSPEELPRKLKGRFGLVWDGPSTDGCQGNTGEYLRYNNPHKASLYLSSGMPVIVWDKSALADFVIKHRVGAVVGNLADLERVINEISDEEYNIMCDNTREISAKIRSGFYFNKAFAIAVR